MISSTPPMLWAVLLVTGRGCCKEKRLREGGVGPEMRSPVGLINKIMDTSTAMVNPVILDKVGGHA